MKDIVEIYKMTQEELFDYVLTILSLKKDDIIICNT